MDDSYNKKLGTVIIFFVMAVALAELLGIGVVTPTLSIALLGTATTLLVGVAGANQVMSMVNRRGGNR